MADKYYNGKFGSVTIGSGSGAVQIPVKNWKVTDSVGEEDTTSTTSLGYKEVQAGIRSAKISFEAEWQVGSTLSPQHQGLVVGGKVTSLNCWVDPAGTIGWTFTSAQVNSLEPSVVVGDVITYTVDAQSDGTFTFPA